VRKSLRYTAATGVALLALAACGSKGSSSATSSTSPSTSSSTSTSASASTAAFNACMVLDIGGVDDHSFNQGSWAGMVAAKAANPSIAISYVSSSSQNDYTPNLNAETAKGCSTTIAVGGLMSSAVVTVAKANPTKNYAEVDSNPGLPNAFGLQYNTAQGAFLGGYLAAGMSKTGKVATFGGLNIPPVTVYMDGFYDGVQYYNGQHHTSVQVLGWNEHNQKGGTFATGNNSFSDPAQGEQISNTFIQQGADIIFPVAGGTGIGSAVAAKNSSGSVKVIWVDTDGCVSAAQYCPWFLTTVLKNLTGSVKTYVLAAAAGHPANYIGTLANGGTGLAPFYHYTSQVPASLVSELAVIKQKIIAGSITVASPSQPH